MSIDNSRDQLRKTSNNLKTRPARENKIEVIRMACDLDVKSDLTKVNQSEKEWGKCLKEIPLLTIREIEDDRIKSEKSSNAIMKTTDRGKRLQEERYLSADDVFAAKYRKKILC